MIVDFLFDLCETVAGKRRPGKPQPQRGQPVLGQSQAANEPVEGGCWDPSPEEQRKWMGP